jgi:hypothetical protein
MGAVDIFGNDAAEDVVGGLGDVVFGHPGQQAGAVIGGAGGGDGGGIISNYEISISTDGISYGAYTPLSPPKGSPPITIAGLSSSTNYFVKLKAVNEAGVSDVESSPVTFTTLA